MNILMICSQKQWVLATGTARYLRVNRSVSGYLQPAGAKVRP